RVGWRLLIEVLWGLFPSPVVELRARGTRFLVFPETLDAGLPQHLSLASSRATELFHHFSLSANARVVACSRRGVVHSCHSSRFSPSLPTPMPQHLLSLSDGPSILIDKPILLFGRHEECDVQLNSKKVSRRHCVLAQLADHLVIRDLGSTNGVRINGQRVAEGKLRPGDELQIGNFKYQVCGDMLGRSKDHPSPDAYQSVPATQ